MKVSSLQLIALTCVVSAALSGCGGSCPPTSGGGNALTGSIFYMSNETGSMNIYSMNGDGTAKTRLTTGNAVYDDAKISPSTSSIVFVEGNGSTTGQINSMFLNGTNVIALTTTGFNFDPKYFPSGAQIVFAKKLPGQTSQIWKMDVDGGNPLKLTTDTLNCICPSVSPDGTTIAYMKEVGTGHAIWLMNPDGTNQRPLIPGIAVGSLVWTANSQELIYVGNSDGDKEVYRIAITDITGSNIVKLTNNTADDFAVSFSPNGNQLIFSSNRDGNNEMYIMNLDGTGQTRVTNTTFSEVPAAWVTLINEM
jgi:Tol biopolymer transport system component